VDQLRSLEPSDIPQVVALRRLVFTQSAQESDTALARYYHMLFFENPWRDERYPSLVQEDSAGDIVGFVGAIPRPMRLGAERLTAVTATELMVAPGARGLVGRKLLLRLFDGPQDLTFSDRSNEQARALYEALGGRAALWYSLYWGASLDGSRLSFDAALAAGSRSVAARALRWAGRSLERLSNAPTAMSPPRTTDGAFSPEIVISLTRRLAGKNTLVPEYDAESFSWLMQRVAETQKSARVISGSVIYDGEPIGWFIYAIRSSGEVDVVQLAALPAREGLAFDHLLHHAFAEGGAVLRGRLDPQFAPLVSHRGLPLTLGQPWTVVRSGRPDVTAQFLNGNAFFSRLDAEWWIGA
jgi:ribosomal protein S18 acetylase RimI-like enzyme